MPSYFLKLNSSNIAERGGWFNEAPSSAEWIPGNASNYLQLWDGTAWQPTAKSIEFVRQQTEDRQNRRVPRKLLAIMADVKALNGADRNKLLDAICAEFLRGRQKFAKDLSINIVGDEPEA